MEYCAGIPCVNSGCKLCVCLPTVSGDGGGWTLCRGTGVGKRFTHTGEAGGGYEAWDGSDRSGERLLAGTTCRGEKAGAGDKERPGTGEAVLSQCVPSLGAGGTTAGTC